MARKMLVLSRGEYGRPNGIADAWLNALFPAPSSGRKTSLKPDLASSQIHFQEKLVRVEASCFNIRYKRAVRPFAEGPRESRSARTRETALQCLAILDQRLSERLSLNYWSEQKLINANRENAMPQEPAPPMSITKVAFASAIGCTIEWYDFFLYGTVTPLVFNKLFFPNYNPVVGTLLAYTTFLIGFIARPVGGIIFGHFGDRLGRKTVLVLTLFVMGLATFIIGFMPTYADIGVWSPIILLLLRVFQGIGIGGEWGGAVLMAVEHAPPSKRGFYGSWPQIGVPAGLLLSAGMVSVLSLAGPAAFLAWGWRVAFLASAVLVAIGLYIRLKLLETPAFEKVKEAGTEASVPFMELMRTHPKQVLLGMGARYIEGATFNTWGVFIIAYVTTALGMSSQIALIGVIITSAVMIVMLALCGSLSDRVGRRRLFGFGSLAIGLLVFPSFWLMDSHSPLLIVIAILVPFGLVYPMVYGPEAALFSELFDTRVRYSGVSFVYQFSGIFASGLTPIIATWLLYVDGKRPWLLCAYIVIVSIISAVSVYAMKETVKRDMAVDETVSLAARAPG